MRKFYTIIILLLAVVAAEAQRITVDVPSHVEVGEQFQIEYVVNTQHVRGFQPGNMPDGIEILYGPSTSSQSSFQIVNGHTSSSSSMTITYVARATKRGTFTLPSAQANVGGHVVSSQHARIVAVGGSRASSSGGSANNEDEEMEARHRSPSTGRLADDLFIRVTANKKHVHEQEPILLTYKVYTLLDLTQLDGKMPDTKGFHTQEVKLPQQKTFHKETVNGRTYNCVTWSQYVMYPQMTGQLEIPSITFHGIVMEEARDPISFITGGGYQEVRRDIKAPGMKIQVDPLPAKPAGFSGGVGHMNISAQLNKTDVKAGDPINLRLVVSGVGNLKLVKQPDVVFPADFDKYDAKVTDKTSLTANGVEGNMVYDILAVPRKEGTYTIAPVVFTYYDTHTNSYKTLRTQSFTVNVAKGDGTVGTVSDYTAVKDEDIHGIMEGKITRRSVSEFFYGSVGYWIIVALLVAAIAVVLFMFRRTAIERADIARLRGKNANKVATRRLRKASSLMKKNSPDEFYDEVLRALWGYVGDKLNMPATELSRDNISERLASHGVDDATIDKFIGALDECEYMRYAPGDARGNMNRTFEAAMTAITDIEGVMKKQKKASASQPGTSAMMLLAVIVMLLGSPLFSLPANAITKANADTEYKKGNYQQAVKDYQELLNGGPSAELYYNLGNAYYRLENITQAVLAYERALQLSPGDDDIRFNLQMARQKTIDKITPESEMFFVTWWNQLVSIMGVDTWAYTALISLALFVLLLLVYLMADRVALRKLGFYGGLLLLLLFVLSNVCAAIQRSHIEERSGAVVISSSASVKKIPTATSAEAFLLHEGTKVKIRDRSIKNWFGVKLEDGREGWIESRHLEII